jgi:tRNA(adenine34) deaminase
MRFAASHRSFMVEAIKEARLAAAEGEVPVGAVITVDSRVLVRAHNERERTGDPTAHAEILAIRRAAEKLGRWRLSDVTLYITLEPCPMCAGAILAARIPLVVYGADDPRAGAAGSVMNVLSEPRFNHHPEVIAGVAAEECREILREFFDEKRELLTNE